MIKTTAGGISDSTAATSQAAETGLRPAPRQKTTPWQTLQTLAVEQLEHFDTLTRKLAKHTDADVIHDLRVNTRRLQQLLDLLPAQPDNKNVRRLRDRLKQCRRLFGDLRDSDVVLVRIKRKMPRQPGKANPWLLTHEHVNALRARLAQKALHKFAKLDIGKLNHTLSKALDIQADPTDAQQQLTRFWQHLSASLTPAWQTFSDKLETMTQQPDSANIHALRIAGKRLRYLLEVLVELKVPVAAKQLSWLRRLQTELGNWHDLEIQQQLMLDMLAQPGYIYQHLEVSEKLLTLIRQLRTDKALLEQKFLALTLDATQIQNFGQWLVGLRRQSTTLARPVH